MHTFLLFEIKSVLNLFIKLVEFFLCLGLFCDSFFKSSQDNSSGIFVISFCWLFSLSIANKFFSYFLAVPPQSKVELHIKQVHLLLQLKKQIIEHLRRKSLQPAWLSLKFQHIIDTIISWKWLFLEKIYILWATLNAKKKFLPNIYLGIKKVCKKIR